MHARSVLTSSRDLVLQVSGDSRSGGAAEGDRDAIVVFLGDGPVITPCVCVCVPSAPTSSRDLVLQVSGDSRSGGAAEGDRDAIVVFLGDGPDTHW